MGLLEVVQQRRDEIRRVAHEHGATRISVFGSVARNAEDADSDIDFLVSLSPGRTLFDLARLALSLENLLGRPVDVVPESGLRASVRTTVMSEAIRV